MNTKCRMENSFFHHILLLLITILTGLLLTYIIFFSIIYIQSGANFTILSERFAKLNEDVSLLRLMQIIQSFFVFIIPSLVLTLLYRENSSEFLHLKNTDLKSATIGILSILFMAPLINVLVDWNAGMHFPKALQSLESWMRSSEDAAEGITNQMLVGTSFMDLVINLIIVAFLAGVGEELFFRGLLQSLFERAFVSHSSERAVKKPEWPVHSAIWIVAFIFSAIHLQFYGFIPRLLLGAWFGYLLKWSGSIWVPILAHFTNNALSTVFVFLKNRNLTTIDPDKIGLNGSWWLYLVSILLIYCCAYTLSHRKKKQIHNDYL